MTTFLRLSFTYCSVRTFNFKLLPFCIFVAKQHYGRQFYSQKRLAKRNKSLRKRKKGREWERQFSEQKVYSSSILGGGYLMPSYQSDTFIAEIERAWNQTFWDSSDDIGREEATNCSMIVASCLWLWDCDSSVGSSAPTNQLSWVRNPSTPSLLISLIVIFYYIGHCVVKRTK